MVSLADLKGKVVLLDFFYKSCAPCCAALPVLQSLHEKYKDKGFVMIGIDPIDDPEKDEMADFLAKRGITYTILFSERELSDTYRIAGYPTLYFLNREGKIAKMDIGFKKGKEEELEAELVKLLEK
jgi:thiol-disulfide isomerase/thioredoxin